MPDRSIVINGNSWRVEPSGRVTSLDRDEIGLVFIRGAGDAREVRVTRYSPQQARSREASLAGLTDEQLRELFAFSQPSSTSPEAGYRP
ncbi:MAG: hypothetical protein ACJ79K_18195 [Gemmatimonadaceae bacterium]